MEERVIIGIIGKKGSGKDSIGVILNYLKVLEHLDKSVLTSEEEYNRFKSKLLNSSSSKFPHYSHNMLMPYKMEAFANPIKNIVSAITGILVNKLDDEKYKSAESPIKGFTNRELLTSIGSKFKVMFGEDIWVNILERDRINKLSYNYVITDVRFPNEVEMLKKHDAIFIKVVRPGIEEGDDISETSVDLCNDYNHLIINDDTLEELIDKVYNIMIKEKLIYDRT